MAGQTIICPTCKRRMQVPLANQVDPSAVNDLGHAPGPSSLGWGGQGHTGTSTTSSNPAVGSDPYAPSPVIVDVFGPIPSLPGSVPGVQTGTNYALPGAFLAVMGGLGLLVLGPALLGILVGVIGNKAPMDLVDFVLTVGWMVLSILAQMLMLAGGVQMIRRRQLRWAKLGAFAALYPCVPCIVVQLPIAIWSLVILHREIAAFDFASPLDPMDARPMDNR
jgi:hypothetical protein